MRFIRSPFFATVVSLSSSDIYLFSIIFESSSSIINIDHNSFGLRYSNLTHGRTQNELNVYKIQDDNAKILFSKVLLSDQCVSDIKNLRKQDI